MRRRPRIEDVQPRSDSPFDRDPRYRQWQADDIPAGLPGDTPIESRWAMWLYIGKGLLIMVVVGILLTNGMYGLFELLDYLAGE